MKISWATKRFLMAEINNESEGGEKPATIGSALDSMIQGYNPNPDLFDETTLNEVEMELKTLSKRKGKRCRLETLISKEDWAKRKAAAVEDCVKQKGYHTVQGYEFPKDLQFSDDAVFLLGHLKRRGVAYFQVDDSTTDHETVEQLVQASKEGYFSFIEVEGACLLVEPSRFEVDLH